MTTEDASVNGVYALPAVAHPIEAVTDVRIVVEPPSYLGRLIRKTYGTPAYWEELAKEYQGWVNEFDEFLRDHRSQDANILSVEKERKKVCSECGEEWDTEDDGRGVFCVCCGSPVEREAAE